MLKHYKFFALLFALWSGSLCAGLNPGGWEIEGDFLYLFPTVDDTYFVIDSSETTEFPNGTRKQNDFGFQPGFRVGGRYAFCECDREFQVYYSRLRSKESRTISGDSLWATIGSANFSGAFEDYSGFASSQLDLLYQRVDGFVAQRVWCGCGAEFAVEAGVEFAYLRLNEDYDFLETSGEGGPLGVVDQKSKTWGVGPQIGFKFNYNICQLPCGCFPGQLSFNIKTSGSILASNTKTEALNTIGVSSLLNVSDEHTWRLVPAFHTRIGLHYGACVTCVNAFLEVGYEFNTYVRGLARMGFPNDFSDALCYTNYYNFDLQGLYVSAGFSF